MHFHLLLNIPPLLLVALGSGGNRTVHSDEIFDDADWQTVEITGGGTGTSSAGQVASGNPAPARRVTHEHISGSGLFSVYTYHRLKTAVHDPAVDGPLGTVRYSLDCVALQSVHRLNWHVQQGSRTYYAGGPLTSPSWTTHTSGAIGLVAMDFVERLPDLTTVPTSHPDFSVAGAPIEFGFELGSGTSAGNTVSVECDNFVLTIDGVPSSSVVRLGTPPNPDALLPGSTPGPVVGETWDPVIDHSSFLPGATTDVAFYSTMSANVPTDFGTLLCAGTFYVHCVPAGTPFAFEVPDAPSLVGAEFCLQGGSLDPAGGSLLTNALDVTVGHF